MSATSAAVAFADNKAEPQQFNISLSVLGSDGCADAEPVIVNANTSASCDFPDVAAGPGGAALVVWNQGGKLRGRLRSSSGQLAPAGDIEIDSMAPTGKPHVAGTSQGWVVAYTASSGDNVFLATIDASGAVVGAPKRVNITEDGTQDQPDIASLPSGRFAVVWQSGERIFFQRFDASGKEVAGDQDAALSAGVPAVASASAPAIGAGGTWFVAAWVATDGTVWGRILREASGFGFNNVDGQNGAFLASHPGIAHPRVAPSVALGEFVAIGWQDSSSDNPHGMIVRRFPLPTE